MAVALTDAVPLTAADGSTGINNGRDFRKFVSGLLLPDVKSANPLAVRNGVLPHNWDSNGCTSLRVQQQTTAAPTVSVQAGHYVCERTGQGPYVGWAETAVTVTPAAANATNPRIDVVYAVVYDQASVSSDPAHGPVVDVVTGTPSASPSAPTVSVDGAVLLAQVTVRSAAANPSGNILASDIVDVRKSTALTGASRHLLNGDSVSDPGKIDGEIRYRMAVSPLPALTDYWDSAQSLWRGMQPLAVQGTMPGTPNGSNVVSGTLGGSTDILAITVPNPGWPYRLMGMATFVNANSSATINYYIKAADGTLISSIRTIGTNDWVVLVPNSNKIFTGTQVVTLHADTISGSGGGWNVDVRNLVTIQINPA